MDKKPSGNTDTALSAIVITIIISYMACIFKVLCSGVTCINVLCNIRMKAAMDIKKAS